MEAPCQHVLLPRSAKQKRTLDGLTPEIQCSRTVTQVAYSNHLEGEEKELWGMSPVSTADDIKTQQAVE